MVIGDYSCSWLVMGGYGWLWVVIDGYGWFQVVTSGYVLLELTDRQKDKNKMILDELLR